MAICIGLDLHPRLKNRSGQAATCNRQTLGETGPDTGRPERSANAPGFVDAGAIENEYVLQRDDVRLQSSNFGNREHLASAVREPCDLHHRMNCGADLLPNRLLR